MFTGMIADLNRSIMPEPVSLQKRFDFALTKKLGVLKLPPAFWMQDPKINPRSDHLLWAALLLLDRDRIELALAVIETELVENKPAGGSGQKNSVEKKVTDCINQLLQQIPRREQRLAFAGNLRRVIPEWIKDKPGVG